MYITPKTQSESMIKTCYFEKNMGYNFRLFGENKHGNSVKICQFRVPGS